MMSISERHGQHKYEVSSTMEHLAPLKGSRRSGAYHTPAGRHATSSGPNMVRNMPPQNSLKEHVCKFNSGLVVNIGDSESS